MLRGLANIKVGFTGTRQGMTADQLSELRRRLSKPSTNWQMFSEFHHGDCVGADEEAHDMIRVLISKYWPLRVDVIIHPPKDFSWRAFAHTGGVAGAKTPPGVKVLEEKGYLERNEDIINATDVLIACPNEMTERKSGSGTWYTIRYARRKKKPICIIWPDGSVTGENWARGYGPGEERKGENG